MCIESGRIATHENLLVVRMTNEESVSEAL